MSAGGRTPSGPRSSSARSRWRCAAHSARAMRAIASAAPRARWTRCSPACSAARRWRPPGAGTRLCPPTRTTRSTGGCASAAQRCGSIRRWRRTTARAGTCARSRGSISGTGGGRRRCSRAIPDPCAPASSRRRCWWRGSPPRARSPQRPGSRRRLGWRPSRYRRAPFRSSTPRCSWVPRPRSGCGAAASRRCSCRPWRRSCISPGVSASLRASRARRCRDGLAAVPRREPS